jgi:hypothetical protein
MSDSLHIIHRLIVEVETTSEALGKQVGDEIPRLIKYDILPKLERLFDQWDLSTDSFSIRELKVDLGVVEHSRLGDELESRLMMTMNQQIEKLKEQSWEFTGILGKDDSLGVEPGEELEIEASVTIITVKDKIIRAFLYFLEHGNRDWDFPEGVIFDRDLLPAVRESGPLVKQRLSAVFRENQQAIDRLCLQFDADFIREMVKILIVPDRFREIDSWEEFFRKKWTKAPEGPDHFPVFWRSIARLILVNQEIAVSSLKSFLYQYLPLHTSDHPVSSEIIDQYQAWQKSSPVDQQGFQPVSVQTEKQSETIAEPIKATPDQSDEEAIFVQNAGLILVHPYLESFFSEFDLLEQGDFRDRQACETAVHLLHYLAAKEVFAPEYDLVFEKYLCGIPVHDPIQRFVVLSDDMKTECEQLLAAVIRNWHKLRDTSPDGLREGFLRRKGKLTRDGFGRRLIVERQSHDVLLSFLPWGISMIRLPWMEEMLSVEWPESL